MPWPPHRGDLVEHELPLGEPYTRCLCQHTVTGSRVRSCAIRSGPSSKRRGALLRGMPWLHLETIDLVALTRELVAEYQEESDERTFVMSGDADMLPANLDRARVQRAIGNLFSNAIKYSTDGTQIAVRLFACSESDPYIRLEVEGQGIGIPQADLRSSSSLSAGAAMSIGLRQGRARTSRRAPDCRGAWRWRSARAGDEL